LFLCFEAQRSSKNICRLPPSASNTAKIAQFDEGMGKDRVFGVKLELEL
jgi:hypothetical protein